MLVVPGWRVNHLDVLDSLPAARDGMLGAMSDPTPRPRPVILAELGEVRRYLAEAPPHHGSGHREALLARVAHLERELAAVGATQASNEP